MHLFTNLLSYLRSMFGMTIGRLLIYNKNDDCNLLKDVKVPIFPYWNTINNYREISGLLSLDSARDGCLARPPNTDSL